VSVDYRFLSYLRLCRFFLHEPGKEPHRAAGGIPAFPAEARADVDSVSPGGRYGGKRKYDEQAVLAAFGVTESSETIRSATPEDESDENFNDWLAGLIDADGSFNLSKQGYASCEITMHTKEVKP
jgi:hypothetical protein